MCILFTPGLLEDTDDRRALTVVQTDDTLTVFNLSFFAPGNGACSRFKFKFLKIAQLNAPFVFNGS